MNLKKENQEGSRGKGFMSGVLLLSASTLLVKIIGLAFKIPMLSYLGAEGMGYFNSAYEIYALLCTVSTAGLPVALSMLVSVARARGDGKGVRKAYRTALTLFLTFGAVGSTAMLIFAKRLAVLIGNPDAFLCICAIAPALLFICSASAVRGYCQGFENMAPTAVSQLIEALSKLGLGILFAHLAKEKGLSVYVTAAAAVLGVSVGTLLSAAYLAFAKRRTSRAARQLDYSGPESEKGTLRELVSIALPITLGSALLGLTRIIDMTLIMRRLQDIGMSVLESNKIYGSYTTLALPVFSLIPALIAPVSMALVPQLAAYIEHKNSAGQKSVVETSMRMTVLLALPASLGIIAFAQPMLELLFSSQAEAVAIAAPLLSLLGASVIFSCLITTSNAVLQSYRQAKLPIVSMLLGVLVKLAVSYVLIGIPQIGAMGAPIGSLACNLTVTLMNLYFMSKHAPCRLSPLRVFFAPLAASAVSVGAAFLLYKQLEVKLNRAYILLGAAVLLAILLYFVLCIAFKIITSDDMALLPLGEKILKLKNKFLNKENKKHNGGKNDGSGEEKNAS